MEMKMSNEAPQKKLTLEDPVGKEALDKLAELEAAEINAAMQVLALRQEEVKLLAASARVDQDRQKLFQKLLIERGLAPNTPASIDPGTGKITVLRQPGPPQPQPQPAQAAPEAPPPNGQA
jgi:hypothetical protein